MLSIHPDITKAETLPTEFYSGRESFEESKEKIFAKSWQFAASLEEVKIPGQTFPFTLLQGYLDEPLLLTRDADDQLH